MINEIVDSIRSRLPGEYDVEAVSMQYPVKYEDSMNTVLVQECLRYNRLIAVMASSLSSVQKVRCVQWGAPVSLSYALACGGSFF